MQLLYDSLNISFLISVSREVHSSWTLLLLICLLLILSVDVRNQKRETDSGRVPKFVYSRQRKKTETMREVIEIDPQG
jgi:hypothetical protein